MFDFADIFTAAGLVTLGQVILIDLTMAGDNVVIMGTLTKMWVLRRILMQMGTVDAMQFLLDKMKDAKSNEDFFASMNQ